MTSRCQDLFPPAAPVIFQRKSPRDDVGKVLSLLSVRDHINTGDNGYSSSTSTEESYVRSLGLFPGVLGPFISVTYGWRHLASSLGPRDAKRIRHFRVPPGLCFKTRVGAQPLKWKSIFILMQIKLIFTRKVRHLASF